jgi:hypothetical protein
VAFLSEAELREFAESPTLFSEKGDEDEHLLTDGYSLLVGPGIAIVDRIRLEPGGFEATVAEIRRAVAERGHSRLFWSISESATPPDVVERLIDIGVGSSDAVWELAGMGLATEPPAVEGVTARQVETLEEFAAANEVEHEVLERTEERREELRASYAERFESEHSTGRTVRFLAWIDGEPVATGAAVAASRGLLLIGGSTLPAVRGRGAYRALVRARWDAAVQRGTPALVTQANENSQPILERVRFLRLVSLRMLMDQLEA